MRSEVEIKTAPSKIWRFIDLPILTSIVWAALIIVPSAFPKVSHPPNASGEERFFYINHVSTWAMRFFPFVFFGGLAVIIVYAIKRKPRWFWPILAALGSAPLALIVSMFSGTGFVPTNFLGEVTTKDGKRYCATYTSWLDNDMDLGELVEDGGIYQRYKVIARAYVHYRNKEARFAVPKSVSKTAYLTVAPNGFIVNLWENGDSSLAFDPFTRTVYTPEYHEEYGEPKGRKITELSPFVLLGPKDEPHSKDAQKLIPDQGMTASQKAVIAAELNNPNPFVQSMARDLLEALKTFKPKPPV